MTNGKTPAEKFREKQQARRITLARIRAEKARREPGRARAFLGRRDITTLEDVGEIRRVGGDLFLREGLRPPTRTEEALSMSLLPQFRDLPIPEARRLVSEAAAGRPRRDDTGMVTPIGVRPEPSGIVRPGAARRSLVERFGTRIGLQQEFRVFGEGLFRTRGRVLETPVGTTVFQPPPASVTQRRRFIGTGIGLIGLAGAGIPLIGGAQTFALFKAPIFGEAAGFALRRFRQPIEERQLDVGFGGLTRPEQVTRVVTDPAFLTGVAALGEFGIRQLVSRTARLSDLVFTQRVEPVGRIISPELQVIPAAQRTTLRGRSRFLGIPLRKFEETFLGVSRVAAKEGRPVSLATSLDVSPTAVTGTLARQTEARQGFLRFGELLGRFRGTRVRGGRRVRTIGGEIGGEISRVSPPISEPDVSFFETTGRIAIRRGRRGLRFGRPIPIRGVTRVDPLPEFPSTISGEAIGPLAEPITVGVTLAPGEAQALAGGALPDVGKALAKATTTFRTTTQQAATRQLGRAGITALPRVTGTGVEAFQGGRFEIAPLRPGVQRVETVFAPAIGRSALDVRIPSIGIQAPRAARARVATRPITAQASALAQITAPGLQEITLQVPRETLIPAQAPRIPIFPTFPVTPLAPPGRIPPFFALPPLPGLFRFPTGRGITQTFGREDRFVPSLLGLRIGGTRPEPSILTGLEVRFATGEPIFPRRRRPRRSRRRRRR